ncbi:hypothetical protein EVAR_69410_1 [Eumeta japonica]|uniref:Uncharacterized protein n=1 Tax=Eumeta variegata TaxID=151549 RepID=A0A4C1ZCL4_EUMVA|nr:hypothetical protein EVAR_69410_1 [Eumeta japonica]
MLHECYNSVLITGTPFDRRERRAHAHGFLPRGGIKVSAVTSRSVDTRRRSCDRNNSAGVINQCISKLARAIRIAVALLKFSDKPNPSC